MAMRGRAEPKNHNPTLYIHRVISPLTIYFFIMIACLGHILESTKGIEIELGTYIDERKCRIQEP